MSYLNSNWFWYIVLLAVVVQLLSCEKWNFEQADFLSISIELIEKNTVSEYSIRSGLGDFDDQKIEILQLGHCWSASKERPDLLDLHTILPQSSIDQDLRFDDTISALELNTTYFIRAYAIIEVNDVRDTVYGENSEFVHTDEIVVTTDENIELSEGLITVRGLIRIPDNKTSISTYGHCWSLGPNPTYQPLSDSCTFQTQALGTDIVFESQLGPVGAGRTLTIRSYALIDGNPPLYGNPIVYRNDNRWEKSINIPAEPRGWAFSFVIDGQAFVGTGHARNISEREILGCYDDFWRYDIADKTWHNQGKFPGGERAGMVSLTADNKKAYVGLGFGCEPDPATNKLEHFRDFYSYDPATNEWDTLPNFPGDGRSGAVGFAVADTLYIGTGRVAASTSYFAADFWKYSINDRKWLPMPPFPGGGLNGAYGFALDGTGYVVGGDDEGIENIFEYHSTKEVYTYNPGTGTWDESPFDLPEGLCYGSVVVMENKNRAYLVSGLLNGIILLDQVLEFNPSGGWSPVAPIHPDGRALSTAFGADNKIYLSTGSNLILEGILSGQVVFLNDLWVFNL